MKFGFVLSLCCIFFIGCDADRIAKLEKENQEMTAKLDKADVAREFELQAKCSNDARAWFNVNWSREKDTILLDFTNHYNAKLNKCFVLVEYHFNSHLAAQEGNSWANDMSLMDVYENLKYAEFSEDHITNFKPTIETHSEVILCDVAGSKCKTEDEFNNLVRPYMSN